MAVKTYTVKSGDTLRKIAKEQLGAEKKYKQLAAINDISNPNKIYVGQILKLEKDKDDKKKKSSSKTASITQFGLQSDSTNLLFAVWKWNKDHVDKYQYEWHYHTGQKHWFVGDESDTEEKESTYSIPENATKVRFRVKPVAKKRKVNGKNTAYWTANWSSWKEFNATAIPPEAPTAPDIEIKNDKLIVSLDIANADVGTHVQFQIVKDDKKQVLKTSDIAFKTLHAEDSTLTISPGSEYKARARIKNKFNTYSEWSEYTSNIGTIPSTVSKLKLTRKTETSVYATWGAAKTAESYRLQYTTQERFFDSSPDNVNEKTISESVNGTIANFIELTGVESGAKYFFRVRAENSSGNGGWSNIATITLGMSPSAPTTWSSTTTVISGEDLNLYWIHNSEDGSSQTKAQLELILNENESDKKVYEIEGSGIFKIDETGTLKDEEKFVDDTSTDADESIKTNYCIVKTGGYDEGVKIQWRVRTAGVTGVYGSDDVSWSIQRTVDVYSRPGVEFVLMDYDDVVTNVFTSFPIKMEALASPKTQAPIGYHISVIANESYTTVDEVGNENIVSKGDTIYSTYFDINTHLQEQLSAGDIDLENGISYTANCIVSMNSGLTAEGSVEFTVEWDEITYLPNASVTVDPETYTANILPICEETITDHYLVSYESGKYVKTETVIENDVYGELVEGGAITETGETVYFGVDDEDNEFYYCIITTTNIVENVLLSIYRREYDGTFTEIQTDIENGNNTLVIDPHPALDYARYRIVAIDKSTGAVSYYDVPGEPVGEPAIIIQWDEDWTNFDTNNEDEVVEPAWTGSLLRLPYNIDVSDSYSPDISLIEYTGRRHPVSYYGTQLGVSASWSTEIPITDKETLYQLRRLAIWMGDVYVREPSGSGYWANITVSFSQTHCELTIPVSIDIVRVEGGK